MALTRLLVQRCGSPVIAAGGIMDGRGIRAALDLGAIAAQLGTAFVACPESSADAAYREALAGPAAMSTVMTRSEEHTSELQSLMRISYAVFCLKNKTIIIISTSVIFYKH